MSGQKDTDIGCEGPTVDAETDIGDEGDGLGTGTMEDTDVATGVGSGTSGPPFDVTMTAVGTSVTWGTGNAYENKFVDLVHRDLNGGYPLEEKYLHFNPGPNTEPNEPRYPYDQSRGSVGYPKPSYYERTVDDGYTSGTHPRGPHVPPSRQRARGGGIIGLSWPAKVEVGKVKKNPPCTDDGVQYNDQGGYLATGKEGTYDGKLDGLGSYASLDPKYSNLFSKSDINRSKWLLMRDIGWGWPTIIDQIEQFDPGGQQFSSPVEVPVSDQPDLFDYRLPKQAPKGEDVDLVVLDGGTNDMQLGWLNNPTKSNRLEIKEAAKEYFYDNMTGENMGDEIGLLRRARKAFPNAVIVVLGYPVWTSNRTDNFRAMDFLTAVHWLGGFAIEEAIDNPLNFSHFQAHYLRKAVAEVAREDDGSGIVFAPPGWGIVNSMMADWPWSFGVRQNDDPLVGLTQSISVDDIQAQREAVCEAESAWEHQRLNADNDDCQDEIGSNVACTAAGVGHPNNEGSRQYADTIVRRFKEYIDLPVDETADEYDDGTDSLRRSLERYGIGPNGDRVREGLSGSDVGTRWAFSHRVVDSIKIEVATDDVPGVRNGDLRRGRPRLGAWPGRRGEAGAGDREQFVLDNERRNYVERDRFYIDPMMRRRLTGPVGNVDKRERAKPKLDQTELRNQTVHPLGHWSDRRLRLGMLNHLTLVLEGTEPDGWAIDEVSYQMNGAFGGTKDFDFGRLDTRDTVRPREFHVASFNDVAGITASDLDLEIFPSGLVSGGIGNTTTVKVDVTVSNSTGIRVPSVMLQYGLRVGAPGRDWQVTDLGALDGGESTTQSLRLLADHDLAFQTDSFELNCGVFVGETENWDSVNTSRSDLT